MAAPTDSQLVARCRVGDDAAWAELVERFGRYVYAIVIQGFRLREHDAEDVFQDVFARAYVSLPSLRDDAAVRPWLAQLTRRCCIDRLRRERLEEPVEELADTAGEDELARLDEALAVREALAALGEPCAGLLDRFFCRDESYHTIAEALDLPLGTIASRISRCLARLRKSFEGRSPASTASGETVTR